MGGWVQALANQINVAADVPFSLAAFISGIGVNSQKPLRVAMTESVKFPANAPNSQATAGANATTDTTYTFKKNGASFATVLFAMGTAVGTFTQAGDASFAIGDILEIDGPATADITLADIGFNLRGVRL